MTSGGAQAGPEGALDVLLQAPVAIAVLDGSRRPSLVNAAWRELFELRGSAEVSLADLERVAPAIVGSIDQVFERGVPALVRDEPLGDGERCYTADLHPLRAEGGELTGVMLMCRDSTDERSERLARVRAERLNQLKDQLLAATSHELRAPVATLLLWERILREAADGNERTRALDAIHQSAVTQSKLVADLIDVSRAISGNLVLDVRPLAIESVLRASLQRTGPTAVARKVALVDEIASPLGSVRGDHDRLKQIVEQLLSHAMRHTPPGGRVTLTARRDQGSILIEVADTGPRIAHDQLVRVFDPLSRVRTSAHEDGTLGLGLTLVRELVGLHGGWVSAASDHAGVKLTVRLPASATAKHVPSATRSIPRGSLQGIKILIVDDDSHVLDALRLLLTRAGATTAGASSAAHADAAIDREAPDVLLCDVSMPIEDGYSFVRRLRDAGRELPVIALTAHAGDGDRARALAAGFDLHIAKPIHLEKLVASILHVFTPLPSTEKP